MKRVGIHVLLLNSIKRLEHEYFESKIIVVYYTSNSSRYALVKVFLLVRYDQ